MPAALSCYHQEFPSARKEGTHPQTPTKPPPETSPPTTPRCCPNAPCHPSPSPEKVLLDPGLEKVTGPRPRPGLDQSNDSVLNACGMVRDTPRSSPHPSPLWCLGHSMSIYRVPAEYSPIAQMSGDSGAPKERPGFPADFSSLHQLRLLYPNQWLERHICYVSKITPHG